MSAVITAGADGDTGSAAAPVGGVTILASGDFGGATVDIFVAADLLRPAPVHTILAPGGVKVEAAEASTVTATIVGGTVGTSIDVSII